MANKAKRNFKHFAKKLALSVSYADLNIQPELEGDLRLNYYDTEAGAWIPMPSMVDTQTKTVMTYTDHFTHFDVDVFNWQANRLPTVNDFQVSGYTGAATYSYPFQIPAGPGGFQPSLTLSYNSQVVDQATLNTQASWVGMGWSLDTGSIEIDTHGTSTWTSDDTYNLNVAGVSSQIVQDSSGGYHAANEDFWKITYDTATKTWTVKDKTGNTYTFAHRSYYAYQTGSCPNAGILWQNYKWSLTEVKNIYGQTISYGYADQVKYVQLFRTTNGNCNLEDWSTITASYPTTISYANGRYRIYLDHGNEGQPSRYDFQQNWWGDVYFHPFEWNRLEKIDIQQDADGNGSFETTIRSYRFGYADDSTTDVIYPGYIAWDVQPIAPYLQNLHPGNGKKTLTLKSISEYGLGGTGTPLPAVQFFYADNLHLTRAENGYGGAVEFQYETTPWYYAPNGPDFSHGISEFWKYRVPLCKWHSRSLGSSRLHRR